MKEAAEQEIKALRDKHPEIFGDYYEEEELPIRVRVAGDAHTKELRRLRRITLNTNRREK